MVFIFLPVAGFVLYFLFGSTVKLKFMTKKYVPPQLVLDHHVLARKSLKELISGQTNITDPAISRYKDMIRFNLANAKSVYTQNNIAELLVDGKAKFSRMMEDIKNAKESINVSFYIIKSKDQIGKDFLSLLCKKAREGVCVRVIYDSFGCLATRFSHFKELIDAGGHVYEYLPSKFKSILLINHRMHRKMVIIDGQYAYTGGINVGDDYLGLDRVKKPWRDTSIRLTGDCVRHVQYCFLCDWTLLEQQASKRKKNAHITSKEVEMMLCEPMQTGSAGVQIITADPSDDHSTVKDSYIKIITSAKKYIYIQTPYLVPDETMIDELRISASSGVDVRIMIPGIPDKKFVYNVTLSYVAELLKYGVKIYIHRGFLHAKTVVSDDCISSVGSTNFDIRSFDLDYEINALVYDTDFAKKCHEVFMRDMLDCREISHDEYNKRSIRQKVIESFCRLIAPLT